MAKLIEVVSIGKRSHYTLDGVPVKLAVIGVGVVVEAFSKYPLSMTVKIDDTAYVVQSEFDGDVMVRDLVRVVPADDGDDYPHYIQISELDIPDGHACLQYLHKLTEEELEVFVNG